MEENLFFWVVWWKNDRQIAKARYSQYVIFMKSMVGAFTVTQYQKLLQGYSFQDKGMPVQRSRIVSSETVPCMNGFLHQPSTFSTFRMFHLLLCCLSEKLRKDMVFKYCGCITENYTENLNCNSNSHHTQK